MRDEQVSRVRDGSSFVSGIRVAGVTPDRLHVPRVGDDTSLENTGKYDDFIQDASEQQLLDRHDITRK